MFTAVAVGLGLAAATGFRLFVPFFVASIAVNAGYMSPPESMAWIGSWPAVLAFGTATVVEVGAYYVPWVDNALDSLASPGAVVAGTLLSAGFLTDLPPMLQWGLAIIVGGGSAGLIQTGTVMTRAASTGTTGGAGNPVVSTAELGGAATASILTIVVPAVALLLLIAFMGWVVRKLFRRRQPVPAHGPPGEPT